MVPPSLSPCVTALAKTPVADGSRAKGLLEGTVATTTVTKASPLLYQNGRMGAYFRKTGGKSLNPRIAA